MKSTRMLCRCARMVLLAVGFQVLTLPAMAQDRAAPVEKSTAQPNICLDRSRIDGWAARDAHSLVVSDIFRKKFLVTVNGWCQDIDFSFGIRFVSPAGAAFTCLDRGDYVVPHGGGVIPVRGARCYITKIEAYTPQMEAAYRDAQAKAKAKAKDD